MINRHSPGRRGGFNAPREVGQVACQRDVPTGRLNDGKRVAQQCPAARLKGDLNALRGQRFEQGENQLAVGGRKRVGAVAQENRIPL